MPTFRKKQQGGTGTADQVLKVFGQMNEQHAVSGQGNLIASKLVGGKSRSRKNKRNKNSGKSRKNKRNKTSKK